MRRCATFLLALLIITCAAFAADEISVELEGQGSLSNFIFGSAIPIALIASYTIIAIAYMASKVFSSQELGVWSKVEMREALMSTLYAALIVGLVPAFNGLISSFAGSGDDSYEEIAEFVIDSALDKLVSVSKFAASMSFLNAISWTPTASNSLPIAAIDSIYFSLYFNPLQVYSLINLFTASFLPILFAAIMSIAGQFFLLAFLEQSLYVFIGLGLFMRAFAFTRRMGSTIIAIFLGGFIFLKLALVLEAAVFANVADAGLAEDPAISMASADLAGPIMKLFGMIVFPMYLLDFCMEFDDPCESESGPWKTMCFIFSWAVCWIIGAIVFVFDLIWTILNLLFGAIVTAALIMAAVFGGPGVVGMWMADEIATRIASSSDIMVFAFFMPFFNIIFVLAGVKALVEAMGGDETVVNMLTFI